MFNSYSPIARLLGPLAVVVSWLLAAYLFELARGQGAAAISYMATNTKRSARRFGATLTLIGALLAGFGELWLVPTFGLGDAGYALFALSFTSLFIIATVPVERSEFKHWVHRIAGYGLAAVILALMILLAASPALHGLVHVLTTVAAGTMGVVWLLFIWSLITGSERLRPFFLQFEVLYIAAAELVLVMIAVAGS